MGELELRDSALGWGYLKLEHGEAHFYVEGNATAQWAAANDAGAVAAALEDADGRKAWGAAQG